MLTPPLSRSTSRRRTALRRAVEFVALLALSWSVSPAHAWGYPIDALLLLRNAGDTAQLGTPGNEYLAIPDTDLSGSLGDDVLVGVDPAADAPGAGTVTTLWGGPYVPGFSGPKLSKKLFVLGDDRTAYWASEGASDYAEIVDLNPARDTIRLHGAPSMYRLRATVSPASGESGMGVYLVRPNGDELIGLARGRFPSLTPSHPVFQYAQPAGAPSHPQQFAQFGSVGIDRVGRSSALDTIGNLYVAYDTTRPPSEPRGGVDVVVNKFSPAGSLVWTVTFGSAVDEQAWGLAFANGQLYLGGNTKGYVATAPGSKIGEGRNFFIASLDAHSGALRRAVQFGTTSNNNHLWNLTVDDAGFVYANGITGGQLDPSVTMDALDSTWIGKWSGELDQVWLRQYGNAAGFTESYGLSYRPRSGAAAGEGYLYLSGWTTQQYGTGTTGFYSNWLMRIDPTTGGQTWIRQWGSAHYEWNWANAADRDGNVYVAGLTFGNLATDGTVNRGYADAYIASFSPDGTLRWIRMFGSSNGSETPFDIVVDNQGRLVVTGHTSGRLATDVQGFGDAWVAWLDSNGALLDLRQYGSTGDDRFWQIEQIGTTTYFVGQTDGSVVHASQGSLDVFVFRL
jgi:hypothetical protein